MPDTVIACINILGNNQPRLLTFIYRHVRLIGDEETPVLGANSDEDEVASLEVDVELKEEEMEMSYVELKVNVEILGVDI